MKKDGSLRLLSFFCKLLSNRSFYACEISKKMLASFSFPILFFMFYNRLGKRWPSSGLLAKQFLISRCTCGFNALKLFSIREIYFSFSRILIASIGFGLPIFVVCCGGANHAAGLNNMLF